MTSAPHQCSSVISAFDAWHAKSSIDPYDDRVRPLLFAAAGKRDAMEWDRDDAERVIAFLFSKFDAIQPNPTTAARTLRDANLITPEQYNRICASIGGGA